MINKVILVGRLVKDPELKYLEDGKAVTSITLAVNRNFRNQNGDYDTDFLNCTLWKKNAENTANFCRKGSVIGVTGRIQTRNYDNQDGQRVYITEVVAEGVKFLSAKKEAFV
ncbi:single-stranded DNA-binding protein [Bacillus sp. BGMRC 2118]|nr:single-stranded DNA-binding protein [Bacillus sp. BGMRC 2118]